MPLDEARKYVKTAINLAMVYTYYEIGRMIVEEEQDGADRAEYGQYVLRGLANYLTTNCGKGFSVTNLKNMRKFYLMYCQNTIGQTLSDQLSSSPVTSNWKNSI